MNNEQILSDRKRLNRELAEIRAKLLPFGFFVKEVFVEHNTAHGKYYIPMAFRADPEFHKILLRLVNDPRQYKHRFYIGSRNCPEAVCLSEVYVLLFLKDLCGPPIGIWNELFDAAVDFEKCRRTKTAIVNSRP